MNNRGPRIVVHDYSGHPGQAQLSRALARRGYEVIHQHCPSYATGKGLLERVPGDAPTLQFEACEMSQTFDRYNFSRRIRQEIEYGKRAGVAILAHRPDMVVFSNVPLIAHARLVRLMGRKRIPSIFWQQDVYSEAIGLTAKMRLPSVLGATVATMAERVERTIARKSSGVVAISTTFVDKLDSWGVGHKTAVVPNWAPIEELPVRPTENGWRARMGLEGRQIVLYSGTLGLKHDPSILAMLADHLKGSHPEAVVVVISEGNGREWLEDWKREHQAENLRLLDFQSYEDLPDVLGSADVLVAILEPGASRFSVPSKVLTYLCAQRAILGVISPDNSVAEILRTNDAGLVVSPRERDRIPQLVSELLDDDELRGKLARSARTYAEREFCSDRAADRFTSMFGDRVPLPVERLAIPCPSTEAGDLGRVVELVREGAIS